MTIITCVPNQKCGPTTSIHDCVLMQVCNKSLNTELCINEVYIVKDFLVDSKLLYNFQSKFLTYFLLSDKTFKTLL
jgi:hypothetical protein